MKKLAIFTFAAGLMLLTPSALFADEPATNTVPNTGQLTTKGEKGDKPAAAKAEQRKKLMSLIGLNAKDLKGLSPADRKAKVKAAADKKISELEQKQSAGTLSAEDQSNLDALKKFERHQQAAKKAQS